MTPAEISAVLRSPFPASELEWKIQTAGQTNGRVWARIVPFITARGIIDRLDEAFGPDGYSVTMEAIALGVEHHGVKCSIGAYFDRDVTMTYATREDVCEITDIEAMKGAASGALKRAAVLFGVGRYLYDAPEFYATVSENGINRGSYKDKATNHPVYFKWSLPVEVNQWMGLTVEAPRGAPPVAVALPVGTPAAKKAARVPDEPMPPRVGPTVAGVPRECPVCGGKVYDNRSKKASGEYDAKSKDWSCASKTCMTGKWRTGGWVDADKPDPLDNDDPASYNDMPDALRDEDDPFK